MSSIAWAEPTTNVSEIEEKGELEWERAIDELGFKVRVLSKNLVGLSGSVTVNVQFDDGWIEEHVDPEEVYKPGNRSDTAAKYDNYCMFPQRANSCIPCDPLWQVPESIQSSDYEQQSTDQP